MFGRYTILYRTQDRDDSAIQSANSLVILVGTYLLKPSHVYSGRPEEDVISSQ